MNTTFTDEQALCHLHEEVIDAINALDLEKLLSLHTNDVILMEPNMPAISGKEEVKKMVSKFQQENIRFQLAFKIHEIEVFGERAFVRGQVIRSTILNNGGPVCETGKFISLSKKQKDSSWLRTHVIMNTDTPLNEMHSANPGN